MEMIKQYLVSAFLGIVAFTALVYAQNQSGFISIDCGIPENNPGYIDEITGINYSSDAGFTESGISHNISSEYKTSTLEKQFLSVRSFPEETRNCYTLKPEGGYDKFLIRARFMYGNYDGQGILPSFNLFLDSDGWDSVVFKNASSIITKEIVHISQRNYIHVCLLNIGSGTPFISALELRPLINSSYVTKSESLLLVGRWDIGSTSNQVVRYKKDAYDRIWLPYNYIKWEPVINLVTFNQTNYQLPSEIMRTAVIPTNDGNSLQVVYALLNGPKVQYQVYCHFLDVEVKEGNRSREMNIFANGKLWYGPFIPNSSYTTTVVIDDPSIENQIVVSINKTENSTQPPILNALEIYTTKEFPQLLADQQDVDAILKIKAIYGVVRNWQGDPCAPKAYLWQGLNCSNNEYKPPRIISLDLSLSGIAGEIDPWISNLTSMKILDLSDNGLTGPVPDFLSDLPFLTVLNLSRNKLKGSVPARLMEKMDKGLLSLSVDGNPDLHIPSSHKKKNKFIFPVAAAVVSISVLSAAIAILWSFKRRKREDKWWLSLIIVGAALLVPLFCYLCCLIWRIRKAKVENIKNQEKLLREFGDNLSPSSADGKRITEDKNRNIKHELNIYKFQTIAAATNNFSTTNVLGKGGFGAVYKGILLDGQEIAIKRLSKSSNQGIEEFQNEAKLIAKLQHTNLVRLLGCSLQAEERILIYEYMPNKSLDFFIFDSHRKKVLNWKIRFNIIEGIAQGLIYLHKYSRLRVIHRDLKASNILLDDQMNPKISDFGMARIFGVNESVANTNRIVGTYGYMSPEYAMNGIVSIKTDVYSFGVLVLEIVSGKKNSGCYHTEHPLNLVGYAWQLWNEGKGLELMDPKMDESCSPNEVLRCLHVGLLCVQDQAIERPTMPEVVSMLTNEAILLPAPKQPAFYINDTTEESENLGKKVEDCSINTVTISVMEAR